MGGVIGRGFVQFLLEMDLVEFEDTDAFKRVG